MQYEVIQEFIINVKHDPTKEGTRTIKVGYLLVPYGDDLVIDSKDQGQIVLDKSVTTYMGAYLKAIPNEGNLGDALFG
jgi:hypothetical protein